MIMDKSFLATNLAVRRGDRKIFENLSFDVSAGILLKLIGPNGSGKSTLLKTLAGLIEPDEGDVNTGSQSVLKDQEWVSRNLCYLGHKNALKREFSVLENIDFWAKIWGTRDKVDVSISALGIDYLRDIPVRYLSSGQTRRAALARTMCHPGFIWMFDEPTVGLDDQGLSFLADAMKMHLEKGGIILCATHVELGLDQKFQRTLNLSDFSPRFHAISGGNNALSL